MELALLRSPFTDPAQNLALEEALFRARTGSDATVLLYRNSPCVVIGRNQNPWVECDVSWLSANGIPLLRRASGGGAVWHDFGNLNISFILPRSAYEPERFLDVVLAGLRSLDLPASRCERRSLWLGERKIAGSAFMLTGQSAMVHACLLVDADLDRLRRALKAPERDLRGRFIHSVPAHVRNLADARPGLTVDELEVVLGQACCRLLDAREGRLEQLPHDEALLAKYRSWEWNYGRTADFEHHLGNAVLHVRHGHIAEAEPAELDEGLRDLAYDRDALAPVLAKAWPSLLHQIPPSIMEDQGGI